MDADYTFVLKSNKKVLLHRIVWIWYLLLLIILFLFSTGIGTAGAANNYFIRPITLFFFGIIFFAKRKDESKFIFFYLGVLLVSVLTIFQVLGIYFAISFVLFFVFIYWFSAKPTFINFSQTFITITNGFSTRKIEWSQLNNVVVKDNILTLDFKSDKLIQEEIIEDADINEPAFNSFCSNLVFS